MGSCSHAIQDRIRTQILVECFHSLTHRRTQAGDGVGDGAAGGEGVGLGAEAWAHTLRQTHLGESGSVEALAPPSSTRPDDGPHLEDLFLPAAPSLGPNSTSTYLHSWLRAH